MSSPRVPIVPSPPVPAIPVSALNTPPGGTLSSELCTLTLDAHQAVERSLRLPNSITSLIDYESCLLRFYQLYLPLEASLAEFPDWSPMGFELPQPCRSLWLAADLAALRIPAKDLPLATDASLPSLPTFAHAVGTLYVLEGSALGSQYILSPLQRLLGQQIAGADAFFTGRGGVTRLHWTAFRTRLDEYGAAHPDQTPGVIAGAIATFQSIGRWMQT